MYIAIHYFLETIHTSLKLYWTSDKWNQNLQPGKIKRKKSKEIT